MHVAVFSTKPYDRRSLEACNAVHGHELTFIESRLGPETARLAQGFAAVCVFVNDLVDAATLEVLAAGGTRLVALRCAGFNNVDLVAAKRLGIALARVPAYSPQAVSEFTVGLILTLNRQIHRAYNRVRENNFALDGLLGFDLFGKTVGVIGTGKIGGLVARTLRLGFGCEVLAYDVYNDPALMEIGVDLRRAAHHRRALGHHHAALPADAADPPHRQCRQHRPGEARIYVGQHQPGRPR